MTWTRGNQRTGALQWPVLGVLLVVSFLAHDLLMAAEAVALPLPVDGTAYHGTDRPVPRADMPARQSHESTPEHPENCRIGQSALARGADSFERVDQDLSARHCIVGTLVSAHDDDGAFLWEEPHRPPGTLRALIQVYRI